MEERKKILIVEDDALTAFWIMTVIQNLGHDTVEPVDTGEIAVETALAYKPDLIFMDIWLSGNINGIETAKLILSRFDTSIIFISGYPESDFSTLRDQINYTAFLKKPLDVYDIENALKTLKPQFKDNK